MQKAIEEVLENKIRPILRRHGGDIGLVSAENGVAVVRLSGQCARCPGLQSTMDELIRAELMLVAGVKEVRLDTSVSDELIEMAKRLMKH